MAGAPFLIDFQEVRKFVSERNINCFMLRSCDWSMFNFSSWQLVKKHFCASKTTMREASDLYKSLLLLLGLHYRPWPILGATSTWLLTDGLLFTLYCIYVHRWAHDRSYMPLTCHFLFLQSNSTFSLPFLMLSSTLTCQLFRPTFAELCCVPNSATRVGGAIIGVLGLYQPSIEGLPGVLGNKGTWPFTFREQGISKNNF